MFELFGSVFAKVGSVWFQNKTSGCYHCWKVKWDVGCPGYGSIKDALDRYCRTTNNDDDFEKCSQLREMSVITAIFTLNVSTNGRK